MVNTRSIRALSLLLLFATASVSAITKRSNDEYQWKPEQVKHEINTKTHLMLYSWHADSWFSLWRDEEIALDIQNIRSNLYQTLLDNPDYFVNKIYNGQSVSLYSKTRIPQAISSAILDYITNKAYEYGFRRTQSIEKALIIKKEIIKNLTAIMGAQEEPYLAEFIGKGTQRKVDAIINRHDWYRPAPQPTPAPVAVASDLQCQSGLDDAQTGQKCIRSTLTQGKPLPMNPCGHAPICLSCAKQYVAHGIKACPVCQSTIDVDSLRSRVATMAQAVQNAQIAAEKRAAA